MHDYTQSHWHEPTGKQRAGFGKFKKPDSPYDLFMQSEGVPIFRDIGINKVQNLPLENWKRLGGRGSYIQLYGTEGKGGYYVVEVPGKGALNIERHLYEEMYFVVEGRGSTEVWQEGERDKHIFEWQQGSLFSIPVNALHQIINGSSSPALLLAATTAPNLINLIDNIGAIFNNPYKFDDRFSNARDFYKHNDDTEPDPVRGLAMWRTNFIPDVVNCELPLDNRRSPGFRRIEPFMTNNKFYHRIGQHENGRYSKAHLHDSGAVLICVKGKGYTYTWREDLGITPWKDGKGDQVKRVDYEPVGMVSAAPGGAGWFHQHFGTSREPFRQLAWMGINPPGTGRELGPPDEVRTDFGAIDIPDGGTAIPYWMEDPFIRAEFAETLKKAGVQNRMEPLYYEKPKPGEKAVDVFVGM
jgi:mannose-6-phosphate isomerase-like protein (cupin superfamily)